VDPTHIFKLVLCLSTYIARPDISLMRSISIVEEAKYTANATFIVSNYLSFISVNIFTMLRNVPSDN
jgi:hypothetical protein